MAFGASAGKIHRFDVAVDAADPDRHGDRPGRDGAADTIAWRERRARRRLAARGRQRPHLGVDPPV
jgi:hypothetical protein